MEEVHILMLIMIFYTRFESAIDSLRLGNVKIYNIWAKEINVVQLTDAKLPELTNENYKEELIHYKNYAKSL